MIALMLANGRAIIPPMHRRPHISPPPADSSRSTVPNRPKSAPNTSICGSETLQIGPKKPRTHIRNGTEWNGMKRFSRVLPAHRPTTALHALPFVPMRLRSDIQNRCSGAPHGRSPEALRRTNHAPPCVVTVRKEINVTRARSLPYNGRVWEENRQKQKQRASWTSRSRGAARKSPRATHCSTSSARRTRTSYGPATSWCCRSRWTFPSMCRRSS